ncbi:MAG: hypothetical protein KDA80_18325 [Planctomycetaceae bacterium]|nr:hypothetical protein [Planctomycetaceae bacterium]
MIFWRLLPVAILCLIGMILQWHPELMQTIFGRADLMWVSLGAAMLLGMHLVVRSSGRGLQILISVATIVCATLILAALSMAFPFVSVEAPLTIATAVFAVLAALLTVPAALAEGKSESSDNPIGLQELALLACLSLLAFIAPLCYAHSAAAQEREKLVEALQSQRYQRARIFTQISLATTPDARVLGVSIEDLTDELDRQIRHLQDFLRESPKQPGAVAQIGERAIALMQLDRNDEALRLLLPAAQGGVPIAWDYCGLCYQRLGDWRRSLEFYEMSQQFWDGQQPSPQRTNAMQSAFRGIAFAHRNLEHASAAEAAYRVALELRPTAELHLLLARLYEEQQQSSLAIQHARHAAKLAPTEYGDQSQEIINQVKFSHFGCLAGVHEGS